MRGGTRSAPRGRPLLLRVTSEEHRNPWTTTDEMQSMKEVQSSSGMAARRPSSHRRISRQHLQQRKMSSARRRSMKGSGPVFGSVFHTLAYCNESIYDRCEECGDEDFSYAYNGSLSKSSATSTTGDEKPSDESTLGNSTIQSDTLQKDWESIASVPPYRDLDKVSCDVYDGGLSPEANWPQAVSAYDATSPRMNETPNLVSSSSKLRRRTKTRSRLSSPLSVEPSSRESKIKVSSDGPVLRSRSRATIAESRQLSRSVERSQSKSGNRPLRGSRSSSLTRRKSMSRPFNEKQPSVRIHIVSRKPRRGRSRLRRERSRASSRDSLAKTSPYLPQTTKLLPPKFKDRNLKIARSRSKQSRQNSKSRRFNCRSRSGSKRPTTRTECRHAGKQSVLNLLRGRSPMRQIVTDKTKKPKSPSATKVDAAQLKLSDAKVLLDKINFILNKEARGETRHHFESTTDPNNSISASLLAPKSGNKFELRSTDGRKMSSIGGGIFSWRKRRGNNIVEQSEEEVEKDPKAFDVSTPTASDDLPEGSADESVASGLAFPVPNEEGQEIAIQDNDHYYEDPANVHSILTMPSLEINDDETSGSEALESNALAHVLTSNEEGTLVTAE